MTPAHGWADRDGRLRADAAPEPPVDGAFYEPIGDFQGRHYERNAFAMGTAQEAAALWDLLGLHPDEVVVDIGCATARHLRALAPRGIRGIGVDISGGLLAAARRLDGGDAVALVRADARATGLPDACADAVTCVCQGGFGTTPGADVAVLDEIARLVRPGGRVAVTAFNLGFAVRNLGPDDGFDLARGLLHTVGEVRGADAAVRTFDLWTTCLSPAHLVDLVRARGLVVDGLWGIEPGRYGARPVTVADPEVLVVAHRPG